MYSASKGERTRDTLAEIPYPHFVRITWCGQPRLRVDRALRARGPDGLKKSNVTSCDPHALTNPSDFHWAGERALFPIENGGG
jgi:hypothetical protein